MIPEPLSYPVRVLRECDIYPAPSQWISFHIGSLFAECAARALICISQTSRLLSQPVPPTLFRGAHPAVPGAGSALPAGIRQALCTVSPPACSDTPLVSLPFLSRRVIPNTPKGFFPLLPRELVPTAPARPHSSQPFCAGLCQPEVRNGHGWEELGAASTMPSPSWGVQGAARGI